MYKICLCKSIVDYNYLGELNERDFDGAPEFI